MPPRQILPGQRVVAWDLGIHDLAVCVVDVHSVQLEEFICPLPVPHIHRWEVHDLCEIKRAPMDRLVNELISFWMRAETDLASADWHIIEVQFHNPLMRALSAALQAIVALRSTAKVVFMGSDTKFTICRKIGVAIAEHQRGESKTAARRVTKGNSVTFAKWILEQGPRCTNDKSPFQISCSHCTRRPEWVSKWDSVLASKRDDMSDALGLCYAAIVKYWSAPPVSGATNRVSGATIEPAPPTV